MHSTVQTGLFSQNLFSQQSNDHQYHNYAIGGGGGHRFSGSGITGAPHHHLHHPNPHYFHFQPPRSHSKTSSGSRQDITASMIAIDGGNGGSGGGGDLTKSSKLNLSSSNIAKLPAFVFLSSSNLDKIHSNNGTTTASNKNINLIRNSATDSKLKNQSSSSSSVIGQIVSSNNLTRNISSNFNESNLNGNLSYMSDSKDPSCSNANNTGGNTSHGGGKKKGYRHRYGGRSFWDCTKPCGLLTVALGVTLLVTSALSALALLESTLCAALNTCSNALVSLYAFSALVCGIVLIFIGLVIVVYTKKDVHVIVTTAKNFDKIVNYKQPQPQPQLQPLKPSSSNSPAKSSSGKSIQRSSAPNEHSAKAADNAPNLPLLN